MTVMLPDEVVYHIFSYLDSRSLGIALQCSTTFYRIATVSALWEQPYFLRWSTGDSKREQQRGTTPWRRQKKLEHLEKHARRAKAEKQLTPASDTETPFRFLQHADQPSNGQLPAAAKLDFYRLFLERIHIDQKVIDTLYDQVEATHARIPAITSFALRFGNDAKDVLTAVLGAQASCPSSSMDGIAGSAHTSQVRSTETKGKQKDTLAYDSASYRLKAYQAHLPTTLRSDTHHLVILHHAREMLEHLQRREAMQIMKRLASSSVSDQPGTSDHFEPLETEKAVSILTMFRGGEATYVEEQLDILAAACDLYLQQRLPSSTEHEAGGLNMLDKAKDMAMAICDFLADHGYRGARDHLFSDLDNHFLHHCFTTNRETLPLSLSLIFCGVANRVGLRASLCNFPMRILAFVMADPTSSLPRAEDSLQSAPQELFWLDVCEYTTVAYESHEPTAGDPFARRASWLQQRPPILDRADLTEWIGRMGIPPTDDFWRPAEASSMVQRASRNILSSVQRAQILPRTGGQARSAISKMEIDRRDARLEQQWSGLVRVDYCFLSSLGGRTDGLQHEAITSQVAAVLENPGEIAENETIWDIVRTWRSESMRQITSIPESWTLPARTPAQLFREWMQQRAQDNDWTRVRANLYRRADHWSEHEQQAAKYAAVNAFLRLSTQVNAREVDWIAGFLQSYFMLDVEVVERDFLGASQADLAKGRNGDQEYGEDSEGSSSSDQASFSIRQARQGSREEGLVTNPSARIVLARMLQAVRAKDLELPRVNRRSGRQRQAPPSSAALSAETGEQEEQGEGEDSVIHRIGTIFRHRTYRYAGAILGWDPYCAAPEDWIVNMGVDRLPASSCARRGGRHQPFYHSQVGDGTRRYVAQVNVERIQGPIWVYGLPSTTTGEERNRGGERVIEQGRVLGDALHKMLELRGLGEYFRCFDQERGRLRRNREMREMFPDDWSDGDTEEEVEEGEEMEDEVVEKLSQDASW